MAKNRYYYYDQETCSFVEVGARRTKKVVRTGVAFVGALMIAIATVWMMRGDLGSPYALALKAENAALQKQLAQTEERIEEYSEQLDGLAETDQSLYRTLLQAEPIPEDVRQVGVGGTDVYRKFDRFTPSTSKLLRTSAEQLDQLEQQIRLQNASYRELSKLASERSAWLAEMPAILPASGPIVSRYGKRRHPILRIYKMHGGIDILVRTGTQVVATGDGIVRDAGRGGAYGNFVRIEHPGTGYFTLYAHLSKIPEGIRRGTKVKRGEVIGLSGSTGRSTGPHLHYEVRDADGRTLNPIRFLADMTPQEYQRLLEEAEHSSIALDWHG